MGVLVEESELRVEDLWWIEGFGVQGFGVEDLMAFRDRLTALRILGLKDFGELTVGFGARGSGSSRALNSKPSEGDVFDTLNPKP